MSPSRSNEHVPTLIEDLSLMLRWKECRTLYTTMNLHCDTINQHRLITYELIMFAWPTWMGKFTNKFWTIERSCAIVYHIHNDNKLEMIGWELFPHSIQKLFRLLIIVEIDEWDINFIPILLKRDMDFWKLKKKWWMVYWFTDGGSTDYICIPNGISVWNVD